MLWGLSLWRFVEDCVLSMLSFSICWTDQVLGYSTSDAFERVSCEIYPWFCFCYSTSLRFAAAHPHQAWKQADSAGWPCRCYILTVWLWGRGQAGEEVLTSHIRSKPDLGCAGIRMYGSNLFRPSDLAQSLDQHRE